ncbi:ribonuclease P protein component [Tumidithrix elongata RA019]|uniref:Ribonuclease P protein component n=1 Tax=Tumidithrix elongata BACA0141 TaxID=2716417 RepID=A0AAW9Q0R1_9CYAN|nr:ribonuclease P protein component [Tumidithrix elongata RA019]
MLPAQNRLRRRQDFAEVYAKGDRYSGQHLRLRVYDLNKTSEKSGTDIQIGIVISKKVSKLAVTRNRIKRQLRAIFRQLLSQLRQGLQIVVTVSTLQGSPTFKQLWDDLITLLVKAKVLHGN